jgi:hypothetical protein
MNQINFKSNVAIVMHFTTLAALALVIMCSNPTGPGISTCFYTIPLTKGNTWVYSYFKDTIPAYNKNIHSTSYIGLLSFSIDSVKTLSNTTFFSFAYSDSGTWRQDSLVWSDSRQAYDTLTTNKKYSMEYHIRYLLSSDTIAELDSSFSPGYSKSLLSYIKQKDTSYYSWAYLYLDSDTTKTDEHPITINGIKMTLFCEKHTETHGHSGGGYSFSNSYSDTSSWVLGIGFVFCTNHSLRTTYVTIGNDCTSTYSLASFNNIPIPPLSAKAIGPG